MVWGHGSGDMEGAHGWGVMKWAWVRISSSALYY